MTKLFSSFLIIALAVLIEYSFGAPTGELTAEELQAILEPIPESERYEFLRKQVDLGSRIQEIQEAWTKANAANLAVQIFKLQQPFSDGKINYNIAILAETVCFPPPVGCFDPGDSPIRPQ